MLTKNKVLIRKCRPILANLFQKNINAYIDLFFYEKEIKLELEKAKILQKTGILKRNKNKWYADIMIFPFRGKFIATDFLFSIRKKRGGIFLRQSDDVWPMYPFETLAFIDSLKSDASNPLVRKQMALDLASGSGAISLFLVEKFKKVISADINSKAVHYARFNTILNNLENKVINIRSDIFKSLKKYKFDYIVWNGPTGAFPDIKNPHKYYPQYIYGGADGTKFTKKFLDNVFNYVSKYFKIKFLDCSLGDINVSLTERYIINKFSHLPIKVKIEFLNQNGKKLLASYQKLYDKYCANKLPMNLKSDRTYKTAIYKWKKYLKTKKLHYVYFSYISITPSDKFRIEHIYPKQSSFLPRHNFGFEWHYTSKKSIKNFLLENNQL